MRAPGACLALVGLAVAGLGATDAVAADDASTKPVTITLEDGGTFVGTVVFEDGEWLTLRTASGAEIKVPQKAIASRGSAPAASSPPHASPPLTDPNESRLMFAPTGRPLGKGNGYFSDHYVVFPGVAYGLTGNLTLSGGFSLVPAVSLSEQVFYASASSGWKLGENGALAVGGFVADADEDVDVGFAALFGVATLGRSDRSLSFGIAAVAEREDEYRFGPRGEFVGSDRVWRMRDAPVVMVGGSLRLSRHISLISESWLLLGKDFEWSEQPFGVALRFFNGRISADVGMVLVGEALDEGMPVPWLSFSYHFGPSRSSASRSAGRATSAWVQASTRGRR